MHPYHVTVFEAYWDYTVYADFTAEMLQLEVNEFLDHIVFSDQITLHLSGKVTHIMSISGGQRILMNFNVKGAPQD